MGLIKIQNKHTKVVSTIDTKLWEEKKGHYSKHFLVLTTETPKVVKELQNKKKSSQTEKKEVETEEIESPESN